MAMMQVMPTMPVVVASLEGTEVEVAMADVALLWKAGLLLEAEARLLSEAEADSKEVLKAVEAVAGETSLDDMAMEVSMPVSMEVMATGLVIVEVALSTATLTVAEDVGSESERKEVEKPLSETGPTGVGAMLSVAEVMMSETERVLMEVLTPATELSQLVTVTVTVAMAASCEVATAPMTAECALVRLQCNRDGRGYSPAATKAMVVRMNFILMMED